MADQAEAAIRETEAQLEILHALAPLCAEGRERVIKAVDLLMRADALVPGILDKVARTT
jgi:hypothetical protein